MRGQGRGDWPADSPHHETARSWLEETLSGETLRVPANRITAILRAERSVTAETALRLGRYLGTGAAFWMHLQTAYDLSLVEAERGRQIEKYVAVPSA